MLGLSTLLLLFCFDAAQAFVGNPVSLARRGNAVYTKAWGSSTPRLTGGALLAAAPHAVSPPSMSLMIVAEDTATAAPDLPISLEQQESIISALSLASSALLLIIISGAVYLSLAEAKNKKELEQMDKFSSTGQLPPEMADEVTSSRGPEEEGNRLQRRMMKKEKRKSGKI